MKNLSIKVKLIALFVLIKIIPLLIISFIAFKGVQKLDEYFLDSTEKLFLDNKKIIKETADNAINDSIKALDKKSQLFLERISYEIANNVANFLYERDSDILFLSKIQMNQEILENFYKSKSREIIIHDDYFYDDKTNNWITNEELKSVNREIKVAELKDNEKEFNFIDPLNIKKRVIPIYKEIAYFDLKGKEQYKISQINNELVDISLQKNTYINSEKYFSQIENLKEGEIYVSDVIGEYVGSKVIGKFTKEKAEKANIDFKPEDYGYAGKENPIGKRFEGIVRFITPVFKNNEKVGYISLALDHTHIMQFTETSDPTSINPKQNITDASLGNYAFIWDYEGKSIAHPRHYSIVGYDKTTGERVMPWLSSDVAEKYYNSNQEINDFLENYPVFENQSLEKKPNLKQVKEDGLTGLDCRYLNFAPQCQGWMQLTQNGGYGSFVINWSNVWKLTTAATIPYYTGKYANSKRGFGFVAIGANLDEFHSAANKTKENVDQILNIQTQSMYASLSQNAKEIDKFVRNLLNELTIVTFIMIVLIIVIALLMSNYISSKIENLLLGTKKFSNQEFDYRIKVSSNDEIGQLEKSFNEMALKIDDLIKYEKTLNENLERKVEEEVAKRREHEQLLIQQSKLASMGEMIGNIAHQWRQPLNALGLILQNIKFSYDMEELDDEFMDKSIEKANSITTKMSTTIDDFRNFYVPNKSKELFILDEAIERTISLIDSTYKNYEIELIKNNQCKDIRIFGYEGEFSQVILNILTNAKDALIENCVENKKVIIDVSQENNFINISIKDNAKGISLEIIDKIFEPSFSTKEEGKGSGIGLYMSKTIIENNMDGKIVVNNIENGVEFLIKIKIIN